MARIPVPVLPRRPTYDSSSLSAKTPESRVSVHPSSPASPFLVNGGTSCNYCGCCTSVARIVLSLRSPLNQSNSKSGEPRGWGPEWWPAPVVNVEISSALWLADGRDAPLFAGQRFGVAAVLRLHLHRRQVRRTIYPVRTAVRLRERRALPVDAGPPTAQSQRPLLSPRLLRPRAHQQRVVNLFFNLLHISTCWW